MSFCGDVKNELAALRPLSCCKPSLTYGFMLFGRSFSFDGISIQTENENVARCYSDCIFSLYGIRAEITCGGTVRPTYKAEIVSASDRLKILAAYDFGVGDKIIKTDIFRKECCFNSFLRGAFLACGNINDPQKEYRAEFNIKNDQAADELRELMLSDAGINMRKVAKKSGFTLYTKKSTCVEDLLTRIGAGKQTLDIIETKIIKEVKNNINRVGNCDSANIAKTVEASIRQRTAIEYLEKADRLYSLPQELLEAALLRRDNPNATLKELCRLSDDGLTVSGLNHRLSKIISLYEEIKK